MSYRLFSIQDGNIVINKIEILTIESFKTILRRDKGSPGDVDGRKKLKAFREFAYIYHMADYKSVPNRNGYTYAKSRAYAIDKAGLPIDYKPDSVVKDAIKDYLDEQRSLPRETMLELIKTYGFLSKVFKKVRRNVEDKLVSESLTSEQTREILELVNLMIEQGKQLPELTGKLNKAIKDLELAEDKQNKSLLRGTDEAVPDSALPDRQLG
jgi:hypothetical protein